METEKIIEALRLEGGIEISGNLRRVTEFMAGLDAAIEALNELQRYRDLGSVEQIQNQKKNLAVSYNIIAEYQTIGAPEKCQEAREKQIPMKVEDIHVDEYYCPACGAENGCDQGRVGDYYCPVCGQALEVQRDEW